LCSYFRSAWRLRRPSEKKRRNRRRRQRTRRLHSRCSNDVDVLIFISTFPHPPPLPTFWNRTGTQCLLWQLLFYVGSVYFFVLCAFDFPFLPYLVVESGAGAGIPLIRFISYTLSLFVEDHLTLMNNHACCSDKKESNRPRFAQFDGGRISRNLQKSVRVSL